ncbi:MAG: glycosyltransferase family 2 protein, partial [Kiritimatiellae bacterium]|nr:glycosyltransferase family 2 protein [Kiritimatiellia bacterium]
RYEKWIRKNEACMASVPGATGACYAIRKSLFRPIPDATILDDVAVPMQAVLQGYRCVFEEKAVVFDRPSEHSRQERVRKRRTLAGNVQLMRLFPAFVLPWRNPIWFQFVSHKMLRLAVPFLAILSVITAFLGVFLEKNAIFRAFFGFFLIFCAFFVLFCVFGSFFEKKGIKNRFFSLCWMFFVLNGVTFLGVLDGVRGRYRVVWDKAYGGE